MKKVFLLIAMVFFCLKVQSQSNNSNVVEGGKVLLEFVKLIKPEKSKDIDIKSGYCKKDKVSDLSFTNKRNNGIKIVLIDKELTSAKQELVIPAQKKEQFFQMPAKVYICKVTDLSSGTVIKKGDLRLAICENPEVYIE